MKKIVLFFAVLVFLTFGTTGTLKAQVAINEDGTSPHAAAMLDIKSTTKGFLLPRMTTAQRNTLSGIATAGLVVYDTDLHKMFSHNGTSWDEAGIGNFWTRSNYKLYTANLNDSIGIGTAAPARKLEVYSGYQTARLSSYNSGAFLEFVGSHATDWSAGTWLGTFRLLSSTDNFLSSADQYSFSNTYFIPWNNDAVTLGASLNRWQSVFSVDADYSGLVGIGTSTPSYPLHVLQLQSTPSTPVAQVENSYTGTNGWIYAFRAKVNSSSSFASGHGIAVMGLSSNATGAGVGVFGQSEGSTGYGVKAVANSASGVNYALYAGTNSPDGYAGYFYGGKNFFMGNTGFGDWTPSYPVDATSSQTTSTSAVIYAENTHTGTSGWLYGVHGRVNSSATDNPSIGVIGTAMNNAGNSVGVWGEAHGTTGRGIRGIATSATGVNYGVQGQTSSPDGYAGYFYGGKNYFSGSVGIGTTTPLSKLHIHDGASQHTRVYITPMTTGSGDSASIFLAEDHDGTYGMYWLYDGNGNQMELWGYNGSSGQGPHLLVQRDAGNVAIGTTFATGYKLSVSGKIICTELRVNAVVDWPDYVFHKNYKLMPLDKLDLFIRDNGHLPGVKPASEINGSGVDVGEMQQKMMEKIEELTLYIIEQQKQIDELKEKLENNSR